jgi:hypothetical protein
MQQYDDFWGTGDDGNGQNMLGHILEEIRSELQFELGIDPDENSSENDPNHPTLKDAILNKPDDELADVCQEMYECAKVVVSLLDKNDSNAEYIANKTGLPIGHVRDAIEKVKKFEKSISKIEDLLQTSEEGEEEEEEEEEYGCECGCCERECDNID